MKAIEAEMKTEMIGIKIMVPLIANLSFSVNIYP